MAKKNNANQVVSRGLLEFAILQKDIQAATLWIRAIERIRELNHWTEAETLNCVSNEVDKLQKTKRPDKWEEFKVYLLQSHSKEQGKTIKYEIVT